MKKVESKVVQDFIGTINDKTIYNEELYKWICILWNIHR